MPVYGWKSDDITVGRRLKAARQRRMLTLRDVAALTHMSTAVLSQLENDRRSLDIAQALTLAEALDVTLNELLGVDQALPCQIVKDADLRVQKPREVRLSSATDDAGRPHPNRFLPLADRFAGRHAEPVHGFIPATAMADPPTFCSHHEQEFLLVLRGFVEFSIKTPDGLERHELGSGDSVYFWSNLPHALRSATVHGAETLQVFASAPGSRQSPLAWLTSARADLEVGPSDRLKAIGRRMRQCRVAADESVRNLAAEIGATPRRLELAEAGHRPLAISAMMKFARLAGYPLGEFTGESTARRPYTFVQRAADVKRIVPRPRRDATSPGNLFRPLAHGFPSPLLVPYFIQVPTSDVVAAPHGHHGEEFIYVLSGQVELSIGHGNDVRQEILGPGDSCYFDTTVPHVAKGRPLNPYDHMSAEVLDLFWCPFGEDYLFDA